MCSYFQQSTGNNYQTGDLADIVRASSGDCFVSTSGDIPAAATDWQFSYDPRGVDDPLDGFGDPFCNMRDPFLDLLPISSSGFFNSSTTEPTDIISGPDEGSFIGGGVLLAHHKNNLDDDEEMIKKPCNNNDNIVSNMLQISPINAKQPIESCECDSSKSHDLVSNYHINLIGANSSKSGLVKNSTAGVQISLSPRNTKAIKRRKSQAKKVVCIPAPAPANSRSTGEVVPSDLWTWRKYGQKPIKGSPYPRSYYRCSSSKGCSARKQVERSRTDPNMLIINYTSEHNHQWPTQRNVLPGSSRSSQRSKNNNNPSSKKSSASSKSEGKNATSLKEDKKESDHTENASSSTTCLALKDEMELEDQHDKNIKTGAEGQFSEGFPQTQDSHYNHYSENLFADQGEMEGDPLHMLFTQGLFPGNTGRENNKVLDPFIFYDWARVTTPTVTLLAVTATHRLKKKKGVCDINLT